MNIAFLKDTTESVELVLTGAVTTNELEWTAFYFDEASGTQTLSSSNGVTTGATEVEIIAAPSSGQRVVKEIVVYNADTASATLIVKLVDGANERRWVRKTLAANAAWVFTDAAASSGTGATSLDELSDVTITTDARGDILIRNNSAYVNTNIATNEIVARVAGDVGGLAVAASRIVGRKSTGNVGTMTAAEVKTLLAIDLSTDITGVNDETNGGTGQSTITTGDILYGSASDTISKLAIGTAGQRLTPSSGIPAWIDEEVTINWVIDGGGSVITTGEKGEIKIPFDCTITNVEMSASPSGSIVVDIWKDTYANLPPVDADSITASAPPTVTTAVKSTDSTLTGWTTAITAGDWLKYNVDSITTCERVTVALTVKKT